MKTKQHILIALGVIVLMAVAGIVGAVVTLRVESAVEATAEGQIICAASSAIYTPQPIADGSIRFAVIGDYGTGGDYARNVADMIKSWGTQFIVTVGDNNYPSGEAETIDDNIGQFYHSYIGNYRGDYGDGSAMNNFYPSLGNHDWRTDEGSPYFEYFTLPGNERYYSFVRGSVHLFILSSHRLEYDGTDAESVQAQWFYDSAAASTSPFQLVFVHHPPYSSETGSETPTMRWAFADWGIDAVFAGHAHSYERSIHDGILYINNGSSGKDLYEFPEEIEAGSLVQDNCSYGAVLVDANESEMTIRFIALHNVIVDEFTIPATHPTGG